MKSLQTPLHRVKGLGSAHSGTGHFWRERVSAAALIPLSLWFAYAAIGLAGTTTSAPLQFFAQPVNAFLMASFVIISLYHAAMGVQVVIDDYVHPAGTKIALFLLVRLFVIATGSACLIALLRISVF
jgi:succinate dehydrogenase / fumarate reductase membrane anchor subunit